MRRHGPRRNGAHLVHQRFRRDRSCGAAEADDPAGQLVGRGDLGPILETTAGERGLGLVVAVARMLDQRGHRGVELDHAGRRLAAFGAPALAKPVRGVESLGASEAAADRQHGADAVEPERARLVVLVASRDHVPRRRAVDERPRIDV